MFNPILREKFEYLTNYFESAFKNTRHSIAQSLIFYGQDTLSQYFLAQEIARILNCKESKASDCACLNCTWVKNNQHPAVLTVSKNDNKPTDDTSKKVISIKQVQMVNSSLVNSSEYYRVFIFCDSETDELSKNQRENLASYSSLGAQLPNKENENWYPHPINRTVLQEESANAMLKSIEEPPEKVLFIFLTRDKEDIIETIVSRSQSFYVPSFIKQDYDFDLAQTILTNYPNIKKMDVLELSQKLSENQQKNNYTPEYVIDILQTYLKDLIKNNASNKQLVNKIKEDILKLQTAKKQLNAYIRPNLIFENMLFELAV